MMLSVIFYFYIISLIGMNFTCFMNIKWGSLTAKVHELLKSDEQVQSWLSSEDDKLFKTNTLSFKYSISVKGEKASYLREIKWA